MENNEDNLTLDDFKETPLATKMKIAAGGSSASIYLLMSLSKQIHIQKEIAFLKDLRDKGVID